MTLVSEPESKWSWSCQFQWGKKGSSTASLKKGHFYFFLSCHCAKNNRRGNIEFCKEADNGASCLHHERRESSYGFAGEVMDGPTIFWKVVHGFDAEETDKLVYQALDELIKVE